MKRASRSSRATRSTRSPPSKPTTTAPAKSRAPTARRQPPPQQSAVAAAAEKLSPPPQHPVPLMPTVPIPAHRAADLNNITNVVNALILGLLWLAQDRDASYKSLADEFAIFQENGFVAFCIDNLDKRRPHFVNLSQLQRFQIAYMLHLSTFLLGLNPAAVNTANLTASAITSQIIRVMENASWFLVTEGHFIVDVELKTQFLKENEEPDTSAIFRPPAFYNLKKLTDNQKLHVRMLNTRKSQILKGNISSFPSVEETMNVLWLYLKSAYQSIVENRDSAEIEDFVPSGWDYENTFTPSPELERHLNLMSQHAESGGERSSSQKRERQQRGSPEKRQKANAAKESADEMLREDLRELAEASPRTLGLLANPQRLTLSAVARSSPEFARTPTAAVAAAAVAGAVAATRSPMAAATASLKASPSVPQQRRGKKGATAASQLFETDEEDDDNGEDAANGNAVAAQRRNHNPADQDSGNENYTNDNGDDNRDDDDEDDKQLLTQPMVSPPVASPPRGLTPAARKQSVRRPRKRVAVPSALSPSIADAIAQIQQRADAMVRELVAESHKYGLSVDEAATGGNSYDEERPGSQAEAAAALAGFTDTQLQAVVQRRNNDIIRKAIRDNNEILSMSIHGEDEIVVPENAFLPRFPIGRKRWTDDELAALIEGMHTHGSAWSVIEKIYGKTGNMRLKDRSQIDLKDKESARNEAKKRIRLQQPLGVFNIVLVSRRRGD
ncbi:hypothetical protein HDU84_009811 [Entophlyctis sp. JEL0112]|nr:hypothetical protein HDU84_009811 [Entophlyctis sp. JEL0112]